MLRNKLLMYRFSTLHRAQIDESLGDPHLSARLNQILVPLLSVTESEALRTAIRESARGLDDRLYAERSSSMEAGVLQALQELCARSTDVPVPIAEIATTFAAQRGSEFDRPITARLVGSIVRTRLRLATYKRHGVYVVPASERPKVIELCLRYGVGGGG